MTGKRKPRKQKGNGIIVDAIRFHKQAQQTKPVTKVRNAIRALGLEPQLNQATSGLYGKTTDFLIEKVGYGKKKKPVIIRKRK